MGMSFYKRNNEQRWRGPGIVIGRNGKQMLVKHSGTFVRVHTVRPAKMPIKDISQGGSSAFDKTREFGSLDGSSSFWQKNKMLNLGLLMVLGNLGLLTVPVGFETFLNMGLLKVLGNLRLLTVPVFQGLTLLICLITGL
ncbi:unnamed protein product [Meganyctiphanes norvegica]|uniref:Uncharacterized protein n=1 Tax=Meganyctiphanes norvegica TaxID=48144 RepID=A0AAV2RJK3_MEGNR